MFLDGRATNARLPFLQIVSLGFTRACQSEKLVTGYVSQYWTSIDVTDSKTAKANYSKLVLSTNNQYWCLCANESPIERCAFESDMINRHKEQSEIVMSEPTGVVSPVSQKHAGR
jgi:hypothetical protein